MKIQKIYNNNVALAESDAGRDCVLIGKGIAFGRRPGDAVEVTSAVRVFRPMDKGIAERLVAIVDSIPADHAQVSDEIIGMARRELPRLDDKIYLTLIEHISFALSRATDMEFVDSFWEIRRLYPKEYQVGEKALEIIKKRLGVQLPKYEASFIAFHLVNANNQTTQETSDTLRMIRAILDIVREWFGIEYDEDSLAYNRFLTHLRFFAGSVLLQKDKQRAPAPDNEVLGRLLEEMVDENSCVDKIAQYLASAFGYSMTKNERGYLVAHISNIVSITRR